MYAKVGGLNGAYFRGYNLQTKCSIGKHMGLRRTQKEDYDLRHYVEELEKGDAADPEEINGRDVQLAVQNMMKQSDVLEKV